MRNIIDEYLGFVIEAFIYILAIIGCCGVLINAIIR